NVSDILGTNGGTSTWVALPNNFSQLFSAFDFLNNPQAIVTGLDTLLSVTDSAFQQQVFPFKLPLIGNALASAGDFIGDLRANVIGTLQGLINDYEAIHPGQQPSTAAIVSDGLSQILTTLGFALPTNTLANPDLANPLLNTTTTTQMVQSTVNNAAETVTFDLNIEKVLFQGTVNLSSNFGIPGLGINLSNATIGLTLKLDMNLEFGFAATGPNRGFFFEDSLAGS